MLSLAVLLAVFCLIQTVVPLRTAVQIGADEGFELAKATLCVHGHKLYSEIWNDQPPLHTFLVTEVLKHITPSVLGPRLVTVGFTLVLLTSLFFLIRRLTGLTTAILTLVMLIASPGFVELSASCMLELPALAVAVAGLALLANLKPGRWGGPALLAGLLFGLSLQMKLINLIWTPLAALLLVLPCLPVTQNHKVTAEIFHVVKSPAWLGRVVGFGVAMILTWLVVDWWVDGGAYLAHFQQSWQSHFAAVKTTEFGSPAEHQFDWGLLLRNWDTTLPALAGVVLALKRSKQNPAWIVPPIWLGGALLVFLNHKPWWAYYYIHLAIPFCWCGAIGLLALGKGLQKLWMAWRKKARGNLVPLGAATLLLLLCAAWMAGRLTLEIKGLQDLPRTYSTLVIAEAERYKPAVHWLYTEDLTLSFHTDIPMPPQLALVPLKRLWSGEMTPERIDQDLEQYQPGLIILNSKTTTVPFQALLDASYRLVYEDARYRMYARPELIAQAEAQPH